MKRTAFVTLTLLSLATSSLHAGLFDRFVGGYTTAGPEVGTETIVESGPNTEGAQPQQYAAPGEMLAPVPHSGGYHWQTGCCRPVYPNCAAGLWSGYCEQKMHGHHFGHGLKQGWHQRGGCGPCGKGHHLGHKMHHFGHKMHRAVCSDGFGCKKHHLFHRKRGCGCANGGEVWTDDAAASIQTEEQSVPAETNESDDIPAPQLDSSARRLTPSLPFLRSTGFSR